MFITEEFVVALALRAFAFSPAFVSGQEDPGTPNTELSPGLADTNNLFLGGPPNDDVTTDDSSHHHNDAKHIGCSNFLMTNHDPQDLKPVNFNSKKDGDASSVAPEAQDGTSSGFANIPAACINGLADGTYPCSNIDLMSFIPLAEFRTPTPSGNDIWGWTHAASGREFALMGLTCGTSFVEITDPTAPIHIGILPSHTSCSSWRDIKTYADHAFVVSEASGHGMQVFDLTQLLTVDPSSMPVDFVNTAHYSAFSDAHNIAINEDTGFAYAVGTDTKKGGLHFVDIRDPINPSRAGGYSGDGYTHDAQCVLYDGPDTAYSGQEICFNFNEDTLTIVDVTVKSNPIQLSRLGYSSSRYTHQGWLTEDKKFVLVNDEVDEGSNPTRTYVFNVEDLDNPSFLGAHDGTTSAIDHNLYIKGDLVFEANYRAGLQVLQIVDLASASLVQTAHFDVYPGSDSNNYNGAWSNYPYFPSGTVIVSGIEQGLFVLRSPNDFGGGSQSPTSSPVTLSPTSSPVALPGFCSDGSRSCNFDDVSTCDCSTTGGRALRERKQTASLPEQPLPRPPRSLQSCMVQNFDDATAGGTDDWTTQGSTCSKGMFVVGTPSQVIDECVVTQPGGDHTIGSPPGQALYTGPDSGGIDTDVGGGECRATSPTWKVGEASSLSAWYYHGQKDGTGDDSDDYFHLELSLNNGASWSNLVFIGDGTTKAVWTEATAEIPAGSHVKLRIRTSDGPASTDLVHAGLDDIAICPSNSGRAVKNKFSRLRRMQECPPNASRKRCRRLNCEWVDRKCVSPSPITAGPTTSPTTAAPTTSPTSSPTQAPVTPNPTKAPTPCFCSTTGTPTSMTTPLPTASPQTSASTPSPTETCLVKRDRCDISDDNCCKPDLTCQLRNNGSVRCFD